MYATDRPQPFLPPRLGRSRLERLAIDDRAPSVRDAQAAVRLLVKAGLCAEALGDAPLRILGGIRARRSGEIVGYEHGFSIREIAAGRFRASVAGPGNLREERDTDSLASATAAIVDLYSRRGPL